jgi:hypothetical protein
MFLTNGVLYSINKSVTIVVESLLVFMKLSSHPFVVASQQATVTFGAKKKKDPWANAPIDLLLAAHNQAQQTMAAAPLLSVDLQTKHPIFIAATQPPLPTMAQVQQAQQYLQTIGQPATVDLILPTEADVANAQYRTGINSGVLPQGRSPKHRYSVNIEQ